MALALSPGARRHPVRAGLWFVFGGALCTVVALLIPAQVLPETALSFLLAVSGANATILVAIATTISSIVRRGSDTSRRPRMVLLVNRLFMVFIGMLAAGFGILLFSPSRPVDSGRFMLLARLAFVTWIIGFQLLVVGTQASTFPDSPAHGAGHNSP